MWLLVPLVPEWFIFNYKHAELKTIIRKFSRTLTNIINENNHNHTYWYHCANQKYYSGPSGSANAVLH